MVNLISHRSKDFLTIAPVKNRYMIPASITFYF